MLDKWMCLAFMTLAVTNSAWSEEPPVTPGIKKQRVSPKLLREAMALPEYKAQVAPAPNPPSVEHLQRLSEKLKSNGDKEGCDLLQRFLQEHQKLASQSAQNLETNASFRVRCQMVSVDFRDIPKDSILVTGVFNEMGILDKQSVEAFSKELDHALRTKQATRVFDPVTLTARVNETCHFHQGSEVLLPSSDGSPARASRELGTVLDLLITPLADNFHRVELMVNLIGDFDADHAKTHDVDYSHLTQRKLQTAIEVKTGETSIVASSWGDQGQKVFLITKVMPKK